MSDSFVSWMLICNDITIWFDASAVYTSVNKSFWLHDSLIHFTFVCNILMYFSTLRYFVFLVKLIIGK